MTAEQVMGRIERGASVTTARATAALQAQPEPVQRAFAAAARMALGPRHAIPRQPTAQERPWAGMKANIADGEAAMERLLATEQDQFHAMRRDWFGWISFIWGSADTAGIAHAIAQRVAKNGMTEEEARDLMRRAPTIIGNGTPGSPYIENRTLRRNIALRGTGTVVLTLQAGYGRITWAVTVHDGFKPQPPLQATEVPLPAAEALMAALSEEVAGADLPGFRVRQAATQRSPSNQASTGTTVAGTGQNPPNRSGANLGSAGSGDPQNTPGGGKGKPGPRNALPRGPVEFGDRRTEDRWQEARKGAACSRQHHLALAPYAPRKRHGAGLVKAAPT